MKALENEIARGPFDGQTAGKRTGRIVAILPRGEAIRNFVYTGALGTVSEHAHLTLLSVLPSNELHQLLQTEYDDIRELKSIPERWAVGAVRDLLDMSHGRWMWSEAAKERWKLRDREAISTRDQIRRIAKKAICLPLANRPGLALFMKAERLLSRVLRTTEYYVEQFKQLRPTLVFNASHVHSRIAIQPVQAAQWLGIPTATFLFSWDNLTSQGRIIPLYDYYFAWNKQIRDDLLRLYPSIDETQVIVTGTPQFDFHFRSEFQWTREEYCRRVGADSSRPIVLYSTGMANHMPGEPSIVEDIADILAGMNEWGPPQLLVRVYPKDQTGRFDELKRRRKDILFPDVPWVNSWLTPKPEDSFLLSNTLRHSALGINVASTISLELCMFDKPVINIGYSPEGMPLEVTWDRFYSFDHYRPVVESGAVNVVYDRTELKEMISQSLRFPAHGSPQRKEFIRKMFDNTLDGHSGDRLAFQLLRLAR